MKTLLYKTLSQQQVQCGMCRHHCVIPINRQGKCKVRENRNGALVCLNYPLLVARAVDPVEKKPLFHFKPGSQTLSIASAGCNFTCSFCQNAGISQYSARIPTEAVTPREIVDSATTGNCAAISYTYTEPTVFFELARETGTLARAAGLYNIFVTNGFMTPAVIEAAAPFLDAANVDLKAFSDTFYKSYCNARLEPVKENLVHMKSLGILVEVTTLVIPGRNDAPREIEAMAAFIAAELGPETPWHISRFYPCHEMTRVPPTPDAVLERVYQAGKAAGLHHVYIGNAPGLGREDTVCPECRATVIHRRGRYVDNRMTTPGACPRCNAVVYGIF